MRYDIPLEFQLAQVSAAGVASQWSYDPFLAPLAASFDMLAPAAQVMTLRFSS